MKIATYPGSFDPITNGHLDIISRACRIFDEIIVVVLINPEKEGFFTIKERIDLIKAVTENYDNVKVKSFNGLLVDFMSENNSNIIIKGLRNVSDFDYELQMALINKKIDSCKETFFMMSDPKYSYVSSSSVKQLAKFGGSLEGLTSSIVERKLKKKMEEQRKVVQH